MPDASRTSALLARPIAATACRTLDLPTPGSPRRMTELPSCLILLISRWSAASSASRPISLTPSGTLQPGRLAGDGPGWAGMARALLMAGGRTPGRDLRALADRDR